MRHDGIRKEYESTNIAGCSSCGSDHKKLFVERLEVPRVVGFGKTTHTHIGKCPNTGSDIYISEET